MDNRLVATVMGNVQGRVKTTQVLNEEQNQNKIVKHQDAKKMKGDEEKRAYLSKFKPRLKIVTNSV